MANSKRRERVKPGIYVRTNRQGKKVYEVVYRDSDRRQRWETIDGGIRAAETVLADKRARMGRGERVAPIPNLTFEMGTRRWQEAQAATLRPGTQEAYKWAVENHLLPAWRHRRLDSITVDDVARLIEAKQQAGYAAWSIRGMLTPTGRIFDFAIRRLNWAGQNPVRLLDRSERPKSDSEPRRVLTGDELRSLIEATEDRYKLIFVFAANTGVRIGEALGLKWRSIDFENRTASITHQLDKRRQYVPLKTSRSRRTIELPPLVVNALREHKLASADKSPDAFVFMSRNGTPYDHRNIGGRVLARAVKKAEIDCQSEPAPVFHSFRHGFASAWIASGGDLVELSAHLGHANPSITASTYAQEFERAARSDERRSRIASMYGDDESPPKLEIVG